MSEDMSNQENVIVVSFPQDSDAYEALDLPKAARFAASG